MRLPVLAGALLALTIAVPGARAASGFESSAGVEPLASRFAFTVSALQAQGLPEGALARREKPSGGKDETLPIAEIFTAERARVLLRSLTVPGWGQATEGRRVSAAVFGLAEVGVWASFTAFRIQERLRRDSYERTARLLAGIDLGGRDEEFRRIVGAYLSSDQYNLYVVHRDAANIYLSKPGHPDYAGYRQYISDHELRGSDTWDWDSDDNLLRYRSQRKDAQHAGIRANTALAVAVINRLVSAVHAARAHGLSRASGGHSFHLEVAPSDPDDATAFQVGVHARF